MPARRLAGFRFQRSVQFGAVAHQTRQIAAAAQLPDQSRRVPRGAMGQLQALEQYDVAHAAFGQVVGNAATDDAAADDDDARRSGHAHADRTPVALTLAQFEKLPPATHAAHPPDQQLQMLGIVDKIQPFAVHDQ